MAAMTGATTKQLMHRLGHASPAAALRYQHATAKRDEKIAEGSTASPKRRTFSVTRQLYESGPRGMESSETSQRAHEPGGGAAAVRCRRILRFVRSREGHAESRPVRGRIACREIVIVTGTFAVDLGCHYANRALVVRAPALRLELRNPPV